MSSSVFTIAPITINLASSGLLSLLTGITGPNFFNVVDLGLNHLHISLKVDFCHEINK